jgi:arabinose-5-phosphate isomerase
MTSKPQSIGADSLITEALFIMNNKSITMLPVVEGKKLIGIIHIHDILRSGAG